MCAKSLSRLRNKIKNEFNEAQFKTIHTQGIKALQAVFEESDFEEFFQEFIQCLKQPLSHGERQVSVERTLDFAAKFCVSYIPEAEDDEVEEHTDPLLNKIFQFVFKNHGSGSESVRFRVCQFANRLLASMPPSAGLDMNLWNQLHSCMSERLKDKRPSVRVQAVMALQRLQDPSDENCCVIQAMKYHLNKDPSAEVRQAVLSMIATTNDTVMDVVLRTRDVSETVRRHAYAFLAEKVDVRVLSIQHREMLLQAGLNDRSDVVRTYVKKVFLSKWLKSCDEDIVTLLTSLDVTNWTDIGLLESVLRCLFNKFEIKNLISSIELHEDSKTLILKDLSPERVLLWRYMAQYLDKMDQKDSTDTIDQILPNLSPLCEYIRSYFSSWSKENIDESWSENLERKFILKQLIDMTKLYDYSDETGRSNLKDLLVDLLSSPYVEIDAVPAIVSTLERVIPKTDDFIELLSSIIEKIHCPSILQKKPVPEWELRERKIKKAKIRLELNTERERQENAILEKDFLLAQSIKEQLTALETELELLSSDSYVEANVVSEVNDPATLLKCLEIIVKLLQSSRITCISPTLTNLREDFVLKCITVTENQAVHSKSLEALALFCLLDEELAKANFVFFFCVVSKVTDDDLELGVSALKAIFDILFLYGIEPFDVEEMKDGFEDRIFEGKKGKDVEKSCSSVPTDDLEGDNSGDVWENLHKKKESVNLISILTSLMDHKHSKIRSVTVEGLCKLLFSGKIVSPELLSRLVLLWYTPISDVEQENYFHQLMGTFFPTYAMHCEGAQEALASATLPALRTLTNAPDTSPLANVDLMSVACFFLDLTRPGISRVEPEVNMHNHMGIAFCQEVFENSDDLSLLLVLVRSLSLMDISLGDPVQEQQYLALHLKLKEFISDKTCLRYLNKFYLKMQLSRSSNDDTEKNNIINQENGRASEDESPIVQFEPQRACMLIQLQRSCQLADPVEVIGPSDESNDDEDFLETVNAKLTCDTPASVMNRNSNSEEGTEVRSPAYCRKRKMVKRRK